LLQRNIQSVTKRYDARILELKHQRRLETAPIVEAIAKLKKNLPTTDKTYRKRIGYQYALNKFMVGDLISNFADAGSVGEVMQKTETSILARFNGEMYTYILNGHIEGFYRGRA